MHSTSSDGTQSLPSRSSSTRYRGQYQLRQDRGGRSSSPRRSSSRTDTGGVTESGTSVSTDGAVLLAREEASGADELLADELLADEELAADIFERVRKGTFVRACVSLCEWKRTGRGVHTRWTVLPVLVLLVL